MKYYNLHYVLGDYMDVGHGRSKGDCIKVNHSNDELHNAMETFKEKTGCQWQHWFKTAECNYIFEEDTAKILEYIGENKKYDFEINTGRMIHNTQSFVALLMTICRVVLPDLDWSWTNDDGDRAFFHGMGYGLFYSKNK